MAIFVSDFFEIDDELATRGVFDSILDEDSNFFINLVRLKTTCVPEFETSYEKINTFFSGIATLLNAAERKGDKFYSAALKRFNFSEVNGINLGFSESQYGAGFGSQLRKQVIDDAFDIIKKGSTQPEIFQLVGLFEENIGPDRLSDMIATIILPDIVAYTQRINKELKIDSESHPGVVFVNGIARNPYKGCDILLLPVDILQELPIARCWDDIDRVVQENEAIRQEINEAVSAEWYKWASAQKKQYLKEQIFNDPEKCARIIEGYRNATVPPVNLNNDVHYCSCMLFQQLRKSDISFDTGLKERATITSLQATNEVLAIFDDWVENNRGWDAIQEAPSAKREKIVQRLIHLGAKHYIKTNNLDMSFEPDAGRGPADFKMSRGDDITVCEVKLSSNAQYLHGYLVQIEEYALAEGTKQRVFVFVDIGNPGRLKKLTDTHEARVAVGEDTPALVVIDSRKKEAASIYN